MHLLSLKNLVNSINLNEHFLECHSHGALFKHDFPLGRDLSLSRCLCRPKARMARVRILFTDTALLRLSRIRIHGAKYSTTAKVSSIRVFRFENKTGLVWFRIVERRWARIRPHVFETRAFDLFLTPRELVVKIRLITWQACSLGDASHCLDELRFTIAWRLILLLRADFLYGLDTVTFLIDRCFLLYVFFDLLLNIVLLLDVLRFLVLRMDWLGHALLFVFWHLLGLIFLILLDVAWAGEGIAPLFATGNWGSCASIVLVSCILWQHKDMRTCDWADRGTVWGLLVGYIATSLCYFRVVEEIIAVALRWVLVLLCRPNWHGLVTIVRELTAVRRSNWFPVASNVLKIVWRLSIEQTLALNVWMRSSQNQRISALPFLTEDLTFSI